MYSAPSSPTRTDSQGLTKKASMKWSGQEKDHLTAAIEFQSRDRINWAEVAKGLPGRTGKQCREKWKNDLRPDICKDPWTGREEYILSRLHSEVGNQWAEIAKLLPGRSENSIKNHWNASLRSKAESKGRTLLGAYGRLVLEQQGTTSPDVFDRAVAVFVSLMGHDALDAISVPDDFFLQRQSIRAASVATASAGGGGDGGMGSMYGGGGGGGGHATVTNSPTRAGGAGGQRRRGGSGGARGATRKRGRNAYDSDDSLSGEEDSEAVYGEEDGDLEGDQAGGRSGGGGSKRNSGAGLSRGRAAASAMHPLPPLHPASSLSHQGSGHSAYGPEVVGGGGGYHHPSHYLDFSGMLYGDASATIRITTGATVGGGPSGRPPKGAPHPSLGATGHHSLPPQYPSLHRPSSQQLQSQYSIPQQLDPFAPTQATMSGGGGGGEAARGSSAPSATVSGSNPLPQQQQGGGGGYSSAAMPAHVPAPDAAAVAAAAAAATASAAAQEWGHGGEGQAMFGASGGNDDIEAWSELDLAFLREMAGEPHSREGGDPSSSAHPQQPSSSRAQAAGGFPGPLGQPSSARRQSAAALLTPFKLQQFLASPGDHRGLHRLMMDGVGGGLGALAPPPSTGRGGNCDAADLFFASLIGADMPSNCGLLGLESSPFATAIPSAMKAAGLMRRHYLAMTPQGKLPQTPSAAGPSAAARNEAAAAAAGPSAPSAAGAGAAGAAGGGGGVPPTPIPLDLSANPLPQIRTSAATGPSFASEAAAAAAAGVIPGSASLFGSATFFSPRSRFHPFAPAGGAMLHNPYEGGDVPRASSPDLSGLPPGSPLC